MALGFPLGPVLNNNYELRISQSRIAHLLLSLVFGCLLQRLGVVEPDRLLGLPEVFSF